MKARRIAAFVTLVTLLLATVAQAKPPSGAIFTTTPDGGIVNENVRYELKREVYLDGGPPPNAPQTAAGLDTGYYVFQVTDPSGKYLLSRDPARCRVVWVDEGVIQELVPPTSVPGLGAATDNWADKGPYRDEPCHILDGDPYDRVYGPSGRHDWNYDLDHGPPAIVVQLMPFGTTPNPGGVYKAWVIPLASYEARGDLDDIPTEVHGKKAQPCPDFCATADPGFGPPRSDSKTDNFKVKEYFPPEVTVRKFHDLDCDGEWEKPDEPEIGVDQFVLPDGTIDGPLGGGWPYDWTYPLNGGTNTETFYTPHTHLAGIPGWYSAEEWILNGWGQCAAFRDGVGLGIVNPVDVYVAGLSRETHEIVFGDCRLAKVHGYKLIDVTGNGPSGDDTCPLCPDPWGNNAGCQGVTIKLDGVDNLGREWHLTTQTGANGYYEFTGLYPGDYAITVDEPGGFYCSYPDSCSHSVTLRCTDDKGPFNFGDLSKAEVRGRKVIDITGDGPSDDDACPLDPDPWGNNAGCQGVTVYLDGQDGMGREVHEVTATDGNGHFAFTELWPGDYTVTVGEPEGFFCSYPDPCEYSVSLISDEIADGLVFGDLSKAEVHGRKVIDPNADGDLSDGICPFDPDPWGNNAGCQGVTIKLDGLDGMGGEVHLTTQTDESGYFQFTELWPGDYTVTVDEPEGFFCSYPDPCEYSVGLISDEVASGKNFGDYSLAEINVHKFFDANENQQPDPSEADIEDIEFCLYGGETADPAHLISCKPTDAGGMASWVDLMPGTYTVIEILPCGWFATDGTSRTVALISDQIAALEFGNVTNCVGLTPGYWQNWDVGGESRAYTEDEFLMLLEGTIAEGDIGLANYYLESFGCDGDDALHCLRRFLLANQLTLNLTQHPELPNPSGGSLYFVCQVPGVEGNLGYWLGEALAIHAVGGEGYDRDYILWVKTVLDRFANMRLIFDS